MLYFMTLMIKLRLRVGLKGQIIVPKIFRETCEIKEGEFMLNAYNASLWR